MKFLLLITLIAVMMTSSYGFHHLQHTFKNSDDVFEHVSTANHQVYILFLYDQVWARNEIRHPLKQRYDLEREDLLKVLAKYGNAVQFIEININSGDYRTLLQEMSINSSDLDQSPITVVIDDGHGVWVQGPREFHRIAKIIEKFATDPESHWY